MYRKSLNLFQNEGNRFLALFLDNGPFAASGHMVHAGGQAAHWDIQNKAASSR